MYTSSSSSRPLLFVKDVAWRAPMIIYQHVRKKWLSHAFSSKVSMKVRLLLLVILLTIFSLLIFNGLVSNKFPGWIRIPPIANYQCHHIKPHWSNWSSRLGGSEKYLSIDKGTHLSLDSKILVFVETQYSRLGKQILESLEAARFKYKVEIAGKSLPLLTNLDKGKFSVVVFESLFKYFRMNKWNRELLDKYCRQFGVGIVGFIENGDPHDDHKTANAAKQLNGYPILVQSGVLLKDYQLNPNADVFRIARPGAVSLGPVNEENLSIFSIPTNNSAFVPVAQALPRNLFVSTYPGGYKYSHVLKHKLSHNESMDWQKYKQSLLTTVLQDNGSYDGIRRILFGHGLNYWLHKLIFIDSLAYLSNERHSLSLQRYVQIDIDDIFVGERGTRMKASDVMALIEFQNRLQMLIPNFQFNLGFSGKYFHRGLPDENEGDNLLIKNAQHFRWFCHMFSHSQAHLSNNLSHIEYEMSANRDFAKANRLPVWNEYSVSPHHSGVYPVHELLYKAWRKVWNVRVTSTEEYPHLRPAHLRRGFVHQDIMVLPRQTCGLYTHTIYLDKYPGGKDKLEHNIFGGDLFYSLVFNQMNVFMTHQSNYANDRLAIYTFESVFKFAQCWTNLQLLSLPPLQMAKKYFSAYPEEREPIWVNPCDDRRHYSIWSPSKSCLQLPKFLILGPQKTGSTALYTFLSMHPSVISNLPSTVTFEEVQFFNGVNYNKGLDWYQSFFPLPKSLHKDENGNSTIINNVSNNLQSLVNSSATSVHPKSQGRIPPVYKEGPPYYFEKSSTYFDGELVPMRVHSLLPHAKLVIILVNPIKRAYSWYQHMRAHNLSVALNFTFYEVVSLDVQHLHLSVKTLHKLRSLRNRCLGPGYYAAHLERWLAYFPPQQLILLDGDELRTNPISVMNKLQMFLKLEPFVDYTTKIRFDARKGFYCQITTSNGTKCLGKGKGRVYPEMEAKAAQYLQHYYFHANVLLSKLLMRLHMSIPSWLEAQLS